MGAEQVLKGGIITAQDDPPIINKACGSNETYQAEL